MSKNLSMSKQTPTIAISDNRGLSIRALAYNRSEATQAADELISCNRYNAVGQLIASRDARLEIDNFRYQYNLAGAALRCAPTVSTGSWTCVRRTTDAANLRAGKPDGR